MNHALRCGLPLVLLVAMVACSTPAQSVTPSEEPVATDVPPTATSTEPPPTVTNTTEPTTTQTEEPTATIPPTSEPVSLDNVDDLDAESYTLDGTAVDLVWSAEGTLFAATDIGVLKLTFSDDEVVQEDQGRFTDVIQIAPSPDGTLYALMTAGLARVDLQTGDSLLLFPGSFTFFALSPDGTLAAVGDEEGLIQLVDTASGESPGQFRIGYPIQSLAFSTDGTLLAGAGTDTRVVLYDVAEQRGLNTLATGGSVRELVFSPDNVLIAGALDHSVSLWFVVSGENLITLDDPKSKVTGIAFHPFDIIIATSNDAGTVTLWDMVTQEVLATLEMDGGSAPVTALAWSPDGSVLAATTADNMLYVWQVKSE